MEIEGAVGGEQQATQSLKRKKKSSTLTRDADPPPPPPAVAAKPSVPVKPAHIRPGLKPVKIPTVDDKVWVRDDYVITEIYIISRVFEHFLAASCKEALYIKLECRATVLASKRPVC